MHIGTEAVRAKDTRARVTNQPQRIAGVSLRTALGRRKRDVFDALVNKLGGRDAISDAKMIEVTRAADLVAAAEDLRGEAIDLLGLVPLENLAARAVRALGRKRGSAPDDPLIYARRRRDDIDHA